jgi:hypothetical protein
MPGQTPTRIDTLGKRPGFKRHRTGGNRRESSSYLLFARHNSPVAGRTVFVGRQKVLR